MRPQSGVLFCRQPKHEIRREALRIASHLLIEPLGRHIIELGEVGIDHDLLATDEQNALLDADTRQHGAAGGR